jgi:putative peptidoglycan lipid II flippase
VRNAATIAALSVVFGGVSLLREQATAFRFGAGIQAEAFVVAYAIVGFLVNTAAGVLGPVFTPLLLQTRHRDAHTAREFVAATLGASLIAGTLVSAALALSAPWLLPFLAAGFDSSGLSLATELVYLLSPAVALSSAACLWAALLNAEQRFGLAAFAPTLQPLGALCGLLLGGDQFGSRSMAIGLTLGAASQAGLLAWAVRRARHELRAALPTASPLLRNLSAQYGRHFLGSVLMGSTTLINQGMATTISQGAVAHLAFANVAVLFALGLGARTVGQVLLPHFAQFAAESRWDELRREAQRAFALTFVVSALVGAVLAIGAEPIVRLMFERGAFTPADTIAVAGIQKYLALQVPWYIAGIVSARLLNTLQMTGHLLWIAMVGLALTVTLNLALIAPLGVAGIAVGVAVVYMVCFSLSWFVAIRRLRALANAQ